MKIFPLWNTYAIFGTLNYLVFHMPTLNPRINVTLSPVLYDLVGRLATHERVSRSMVIRELLETAEPMFLQALVLMDAAKGASAKARETLRIDLDSSIKAAEGTAHLMMGNLAMHTRDLVDDAQAIKGRRPASRKAVPLAVGLLPVVSKAKAVRNASVRPPLSNRGVKS